MSSIYNAALTYHDAGLHPIPIRPETKKPLVSWKDYQARQPTLEELRLWWQVWPNANVALVLGRGTFAVDLDSHEAARAFEARIGPALKVMNPPTVKTGKGIHLYFSTVAPIPDRVGLMPGVDLRGVGYCLAPPSLHPSGATYEWLVPLRIPFPVAPVELLDLVFGNPDKFTDREQVRKSEQPLIAKDPIAWVLEALGGVGEGQRNHTCARLAGYFLGRGLEASVVERVLINSFARNCTPNMSPSEVRLTVQSIAKREAIIGDPDQPRLVNAVHIGEAIDAWVKAHKEGPPKMVPTPMPALNAMLGGGFSPGELILLGARPGVGKTAFALSCARYAAGKGYRSLIVSREMLIAALIRRMLAQETKIESKRIKARKLDNVDELYLERACAHLAGLPVWLTDQVVSLADLTDLVLSMRDGIDMVIVDYLQLVKAPAGIKERRLQVDAISQGLKTLATQCDIPVITLSSLSRPGDRDPRPALDMLRESGELEHDADTVIFLHPKDARTVELIAAKVRDGAVGDFEMRFTREALHFEELATKASVA